jgi:hypothetical protein
MTYAQFLDRCRFHDDNNSLQKYIYLTLLDNDDHLSLLNIDHLIDYTQRFFQMKVKIFPLFANIHWNKTKQTWICKLFFFFFLSCNIFTYIRYN